MTNPMTRLLLRTLKVPEEPSAPAGAAGTLRTFRAGKGYYKYRVVLWLLGQGLVFLVSVFVAVVIFFLTLMVTASSKGIRFGKGTAHPNLLNALDEATMGTIISTTLVVFWVWMLTHSIIRFYLMKLDYEMRWYMVTDRSLRIREGIVYVRELTMSFANIQNISIVQGPIQKIFGVADLCVESAGGGPVQPGKPNLHVAYFRGIENAEELKKSMLQKLKNLKDGGLGDHDEHPSARSQSLPLRHHTEALDTLREVVSEARLLNQALRRKES